MARGKAFKERVRAKLEREGFCPDPDFHAPGEDVGALRLIMFRRPGPHESRVVLVEYPPQGRVSHVEIFVGSHAASTMAKDGVRGLLAFITGFASR